MKKWSSIILMMMILIGGIYVAYIHESKAETVIIEKKEDKKQSITIESNPIDHLDNDEIRSRKNIRYIKNQSTMSYGKLDKAIGWRKDRLVVFEYKLCGRFESTLKFEEYEIKDNQLKIVDSYDFEIKTENDYKNQVSHYSDTLVFCDTEILTKLSPDGENILISMEYLQPKEKGDKVKVFNKGISYIYNIEKRKLTRISDDVRYAKWSQDGKSVFGEQYIIVKAEKDSDKYCKDFEAKIYKHNEYVVKDMKINNIINNKELFDECYVSKDVYDNILNNRETIENLKKEALTKRRILFENSRKANESGIEKDKSSFQKWIQDREIIGIYKGKYILDSVKGANSIIQIDKKSKERDITIDNEFIDHAIVVDNLLVYGGSYKNRNGVSLNTCNLDTKEKKLLYKGCVTAFAYSEETNKLAFYDNDKKELFIGDFIKGELTNIKYYYTAKNNIFNLYFSKNGKLYAECSSEYYDLIIDLKTGKKIYIDDNFS
ncbi:hypothetical protein PV797_02475 [Clostridiaceae bacterium M8S5]|nr:hypothetical protein PV797_02475 [Clostridiaceae bacterium M8S5]